MNFKQFLKPEWRKIVIFLIIFMIILFLKIFCSKVTIVGRGDGPSGPTYTKSEEYRCYNLSEIVFNRFSFYPYYLISVLIVSYIFSCLIVWIYDKFRKNKVKKK